MSANVIICPRCKCAIIFGEKCCPDCLLPISYKVVGDER